MMEGDLYDPKHKHCNACFNLAVYQGTMSKRTHKALGPGVLSRKSSAWWGEHAVTVWIPAPVPRESKE